MKPEDTGKTEKNRWCIALSAVGIHVSIGAVYAFSVYTRPLLERWDWHYEQTTLAFSIAMVCLGLSAAFLGRFVERRGPRFSGRLAACFYGSGLLVSALATQFGWIYLFYLGYGVLGGIGLGIGYIAPVSTLVKWFPDRRGLATGLAIMGFGFGALLAGPVVARLIVLAGIPSAFAIQAAVYFVVMIAASSYLAPPRPNWMPAGFRAALDAGTRVLKQDLSQMTALQALRTRRFYFLWIMLFTNVCCGIAVISLASPMAQEIVGMTAAQAATMVGLMGLFNGLGRIGWASFSDYIGRPMTYTVFFTLQVFAFMLLPGITQPLMFQLVIFLVLTCYGGGFASIPAYIGDMFGTRELSAIHGYILTAWSAAGICGPMLAATLREHTGSFSGTLYVFSAMFVGALLVSVWIQFDIRALRRISATPEH